MNQKLQKIFLTIFLFGLTFAQNAELITQKINVENAIRDKVSVTINKLLDPSQYVIIVNARMDVKAFGLGDTEVDNNSSKNNYYSPIPGLLPTVPQNIKQPTGNTFNYATDKYLLYGMDIAIYLEESIADGQLKQNINRLIREAIPEFVDCEDCIRFETMSMKNNKSSTYQDLLDKIEKLEEERRAADQQIINWKFDQLEEQLSLSEDARNEWEAQARQRERSRHLSDSLRLEGLQKIETEYRKKQDSLYLITSLKLDEAIRGRIESESDLNDKLIDIIKTGLDGNADKDLIAGGSKDDMDIDRQQGVSSATILWFAIAIILLLLSMLLFFVLKQQKQPLYLKPKTKSNNNNGAQTTDSTIEDEPIEFSTTHANDNEDVMRSELKSIRQSAVAMSVSQKDGANQIVKDWLDDAGDDSSLDDNEEIKES